MKNILFALIFFVGCEMTGDGIQTTYPETDTLTATQTSTGAVGHFVTPTHSQTATETETQSVTNTVSKTETSVSTGTQTDTQTSTSTQSATDTVSKTETQTSTLIQTVTTTQSVTQTKTDTSSSTSTQTSTQSVTQTQTTSTTSTATQTYRIGTQIQTVTATGTATQTFTFVYASDRTKTETITNTATTVNGKVNGCSVPQPFASAFTIFVGLPIEEACKDVSPPLGMLLDSVLSSGQRVCRLLPDCKTFVEFGACNDNYFATCGYCAQSCNTSSAYKMSNGPVCK
jgi:hypothetical protein